MRPSAASFRGATWRYQGSPCKQRERSSLLQPAHRSRAMLSFLDGETRLHVIVGDPVGQTKSPAGLTAEFAARKVNAVCIPVHVGGGDFDVFMAAAKRVINLDGIVVTIPHKFAALGHCDEVSHRARLLGAVNV